MLTYQEVYKILISTQKKYLGKATEFKANNGQRKRFERLATIAGILAEDVQKNKLMIKDRRINIGLSLEYIAKRASISKQTTEYNIGAIRLETGLIYDLKGFTSKARMY